MSILGHNSHMDKFVIRSSTMPVSARKPSATTSSTSSSPGISASSADGACQIMYKAATTFAPPPVLAVQEALTPVLNSRVTQLIHPDDLGTASPCQSKLKTYPYTKFGDKNRSFGGIQSSVG